MIFGPRDGHVEESAVLGLAPHLIEVLLSPCHQSVMLLQRYGDAKGVGDEVGRSRSR